MPTATLRCGLQGKARQVRERGRAARMYTQQWIDEYLEPEESEERPRRPIPIRANSEFLPSVFEWTPAEPSARERQSAIVGENLNFKGVARAERIFNEETVRLLELPSAEENTPDTCAETLCPGVANDGNRESEDVRASQLSFELDRNSTCAAAVTENKPRHVTPTPLRSARVRSIGAAGRATARTEPEPPMSRRTGFWMGCAMGTAAAIVLLMVIRFAAGTM